MTVTPLKAPFPWYGGKSRVAAEVWERLGNVPNYVEPFAGSLAVLLGRPHPPGLETVNDRDAHLTNFWRSIRHEPETVVEIAAWPVLENDLHAQNVRLCRVRDELAARLEGDPDYYDAELAGWWVWGICLWIGAGWADKRGSWWPNEDGLLARSEEPVYEARHKGGPGVPRKRFSAHPRGVMAKCNAPGTGVSRRRFNASSQGVKRSKPAIGHGDRGVHSSQKTKQYNGVWRCKPFLTGTQGIQRAVNVLGWMQALCERLASVRVLCGDWARCVTPSLTTTIGLTGVFLDPPYGEETGRDMRCYVEEGGDIAARCLEWCRANGDNPLLRIALCGEAGEHDALLEQGWTCMAWRRTGSASRGGSRAETRDWERIWFSPHCLAEQGYEEMSLFGGAS